MARFEIISFSTAEDNLIYREIYFKCNYKAWICTLY
jgi:hypothetical protein